MAPIRIGIIGLSRSGSWASRTHVLYLKNTAKYQIAGILNSSRESSEAAIKHYELSPSVKAYASAEELAADPNLDLVLCSVRVDKHYATIKPAIEAGKDCYVEWPLGANLQEAEELNSLAKSKGIKTIVGLQGRHNPLGAKVKQLIEDGAIGKPISSTITCKGASIGPTTPESLWYLNDMKVGGNMLTIFFGHLMDFVLHILGEPKSYDSLLATGFRQVELIGANGEVTGKTTRNAPDQILFQGVLQSGLVISSHMRGGKPFKGTPSFHWVIYGQAGEIEVTTSSPFITFSPDDQQIRVHTHATDEVKVVDWKVDDAVSELPSPAPNVARVYEAFADGRKDGYVDWDEAIDRYKMIDSMGKGNGTSIEIRSDNRYNSTVNG